MNGQKRIIAVVDGQGGGIGKLVIERLKRDFPELHLRALGTNSAATNRMLKAGADDGATGENAIVVNAARADIIIGVLGIVLANSILGELTPAMAQAIGSSEALKIFLPIERCGARVAMVAEGTIPQYIDRMATLVKEALCAQEVV